MTNPFSEEQIKAMREAGDLSAWREVVDNDPQYIHYRTEKLQQIDTRLTALHRALFPAAGAGGELPPVPPGDWRIDSEQCGNGVVGLFRVVEQGDPEYTEDGDSTEDGECLVDYTEFTASDIARLRVAMRAAAERAKEPTDGR